MIIDISYLKYICFEAINSGTYVVAKILTRFRLATGTTIQELTIQLTTIHQQKNKFSL